MSSAGDGSVVRVYSDGELANSKSNTLNTDTGEIDETGIGPLHWIDAPGRTVSIETSSNLLNWVPLATNLTVGAYTNAAPDPGSGAQFFRLKSP
jgi:hypothetical protein